MIIGIDTKALAKAHTGIAVYIESMIGWFHELENDNEYILFSHIDFDMPKNWTRCKKVIFKPVLTGSLGICYGINKLIDIYKIDVFWGPEHCLPLTKGNYKKIVTIHDISVIINPAWGTTYNSILQKFLVKRSLRAADKVIAISKSTKQDLLDKFDIDEEKAQVIYNGDSPYNYKQRSFNDEESKSIRSKYGISSKYFLYCGTIEPRKNIPTIVKAYEEFRRRNVELHTQLILCGGLGWKYEPILKKIKESEYANDIIQTGFVTEQEKEFFYQNAVALLFPSLYEGLGLPILEAMSCGTPVITARNSSLPEVGGDVAFYIAEVTDYGTMAEYMMQLYVMDLAEKLQLGEKCKTYAKKFSKIKCAEEILKMVESAVEK